MKTINHIDEINTSIYAIHSACLLLSKNRYLTAHSKMALAINSFLAAIEAIPEGDKSDVISKVEDNLQYYYKNGFSYTDKDDLEKTLDNVILIKGRKEFK